MSKNKTILVCLNYFQIGGVETFVYNQVLALIGKGYNVIVLGKDGVYSNKFKATGATIIPFEFENKIYYDYEKIQQFIKILKDYNVSEVHNNSFQSMNVVMPACLLTNTPYVVYAHMSESVIEDEYNFFEEHYETYKDNIKLFYKYANKIIAITPKTKGYIEKRFGIEDKNKVLYIRNSISFDEFKPELKVEKIEKILIISRLEELKYKSVIDGIELFNELRKENNNISLRIAGDGKVKKEIEKYVEDNNIINVKFLGAISNVKEEMEKCDAVIGVGRCIIEAAAMKRIAIISGYTGMRDLLSEKNYETELNDNFAGRYLDLNDIKAIAKKINKMTEKQIHDIVEYNYKRVLEDLDINKNLYIVNEDNYKYDIDFSELMTYMVKINSIIGKKEEFEFNKMENDWKEHLKYKDWIEEKEKEYQQEMKELNNKIEMYEHSKAIRLTNKIKRLIGKKGKD